MVVEAHWTSERRGHEHLATEQPPYSLLVRGIETDLLQVCRQYAMGVLSWTRWLGAGCRAGTGPARKTSPGGPSVSPPATISAFPATPPNSPP